MSAVWVVTVEGAVGPPPHPTKNNRTPNSTQMVRIILNTVNSLITSPSQIWVSNPCP